VLLLHAQGALQLRQPSCHACTRRCNCRAPWCLITPPWPPLLSSWQAPV